MENKYYTPELSEFHVGFEFELRVWGSDKWDKSEISEPWEIDAAFDRAEPRVKYLDKEDIESLGWNIYSNGDYWRGVYKQENTDFSKPQIVIKNYEDNNYIIFRLKEEGGIILSLFIGEIKNKSELSKLMKQLNVI